MRISDWSSDVCSSDLYFFYPVAQQRINIWLFDKGDSFQVDKAHATLTAGGLIGTGPGAGLAKFQLPEAHTDYIFSVIGEEFGMIACIAIAALYLAIIVRVLVRLLDEADSFLILAVAIGRASSRERGCQYV